MASVATPALKSHKPRRAPASFGGALERFVLAGVFVYLAIAIVNYPAMALWSRPWGALLAAVAVSSLWWEHLESAGLRRAWGMAAASTLLLLLARPWLQPKQDLRAWMGALGCGLFVYAMVWIYAAHEREPGLQSLATAALVLSIGILAKPAVVAGCACLSFAVFLDERRYVGGWWRSALLLLTPVLLCAALLGFLNRFWSGGLESALWGVSAPQLVSERLWSWSGMAGLAHVLWFPLGILAGQLLEGRTRKTALAYLFLIAFVGAIGTASWMPYRLTVADLTIVIVGGACSLLALDPPRHWFCRLLMLFGMAMSLRIHPNI